MGRLVSVSAPQGWIEFRLRPKAGEWTEWTALRLAQFAREGQWLNGARYDTTWTIEFRLVKEAEHEPA